MSSFVIFHQIIPVVVSDVPRLVQRSWHTFEVLERKENFRNLVEHAFSHLHILLVAKLALDVLLALAAVSVKILIRVHVRANTDVCEVHLNVPVYIGHKSRTRIKRNDADTVTSRNMQNNAQRISLTICFCVAQQYKTL